MSILIFFGVLFLLVLVHEWGHYITAKLTGMRVDEFGIGFPPKLFGIKKGETEYTLNVLPLGGFVKIYGEDGITDPGAVIKGEDYSRSFIGKNRFAQAIVLVAGVTMNILFAWFLFSFAFMWGVERSVDESTASPEARLIISDVLPEGPAADAELPRGSFVTAVTRNGEPLASLTPTAFSEFVAENPGMPLQIAYTHAGELFLANIVPEKGIIENEPDRAAVGVALTMVDHIEYSFFAGIKEGFVHTIDSTRAIVAGTYGLARDAFKGQADLTQVAGPIGIVGLVGEASAFGFSALLMFTAFISLNLAVINLLPFPALDGGRLLFVIIETITRRPLPVRATQILNTVGFFLLISLMLIVTWNDIARLI
jgi:regulator of sigma E protease